MRNTRPPAITACASEIGANASAATWNPHEPIATSIPITYQREPNSASEVRTGRRASTAGAEAAPRCLSRNPITAVSAVATANTRPSRTDELIPGSLPCAAGRLAATGNRGRSRFGRYGERMLGVYSSAPRGRQTAGRMRALDAMAGTT